MWNSPLVSTASGGMLFLPSYFFPHTCTAPLCNFFVLLLLFSPTPTLLIVLNIYTSVSLSNSAPSLPSCHTPSLPVTLPLWGTPGV